MEDTHPAEDWREFYRLVVEGLGLSPTEALLDDIVRIERGHAPPPGVTVEAED
jgi:hypothetical protein